MRILVIDDELAVATVLAEALEHQGNQVTVASSGPEGLQLLEESRPDAVFLDLVMPGMDGTEVLRRIRAKDATLPVIIVSGWATEEQIEAAKRLGVSDVVQKPVALKHLAAALSRLRKT